MRGRAVVWQVAVIVVWLGLVAVFFVAGSGTATLYALAGFPLTIGVGVVVNRWWVLLVPWVVELVAIVLVALSTNGPDGEGWGDWIVFSAAFFTIPASIALFLGVAARRGATFFARLDDAPDPEPR